MLYFASKMFLLSAVTLFIYIDVITSQEYIYYESIGGWLKKHKLAATWKEADDKCRQEGAELAVPSTENLMTAMRFMSLDKDSAAFIGLGQRYAPGIYVTDKGVPLYDLPVMSMIGSLNPVDGRCLIMDVSHIWAEQCYNRRPFICYRKKSENDTMTECGTYDKQYVFNATTGSCYKYNTHKCTWNEAYERCINEGGYLTVINDQTEAMAIKSMIASNTAYIGVRLVPGDKIWRSIHGDPLHTIYYDQRFDYDASFSDYRGRCAVISSSGAMSAIKCEATENFICERDPRNKRFSFGEL